MRGRDLGPRRESSDGMRSVRGGDVLRRRHGADSAMRDRDLGPRWQSSDGVRCVDELRAWTGGGRQRHRHDGPDVREVRERKIQRNGERGELHGLVKLPAGRLRERRGDIDLRSPVRGLRGLLQQHRRQLALVHERSLLPERLPLRPPGLLRSYVRMQVTFRPTLIMLMPYRAPGDAAG